MRGGRRVRAAVLGVAVMAVSEGGFSMGEALASPVIPEEDLRGCYELPPLLEENLPPRAATVPWDRDCLLGLAREALNY
jgi:hypothetical protein